MPAQPQRKAEEIGGRMTAMDSALRSGLQLNQVAWKSVHNDLLKLYKVPSESAVASALLACLESYRFDRSQQALEWAVRARAMPHIQGDHLGWLYSAAVRLGEFSFADEIEAQANAIGFELELKKRIALSMQMGLIRKAASLMFPNGTQGADTWRGSFIDLKRASDYMGFHGIEDTAVSTRMQLAHRLYSELTKQPVFNCVVEATDVGVLLGFPHFGSVEEGEAIEWRIAEAMAEKFEDTLGEHVSFVAYPSEALAWDDDSKELNVCRS
ncbi:hypothetical protein HFP05_00490 [Rhodanobacter denitrificans]|nr:hypothetical protein [Rhodanobacter denitrificans]